MFLSSKERPRGLCSTEFMRDHTQNLSDLACGYVLFSLQFSTHLSKGMERSEKRGKKREREIHFISSIAFGGLEQLEPLFEN